MILIDGRNFISIYSVAIYNWHCSIHFSSDLQYTANVLNYSNQYYPIWILLVCEQRIYQHVHEIIRVTNTAYYHRLLITTINYLLLTQAMVLLKSNTHVFQGSKSTTFPYTNESEGRVKLTQKVAHTSYAYSRDTLV